MKQTNNTQHITDLTYEAVRRETKEANKQTPRRNKNSIWNNFGLTSVKRFGAKR